MVEAVIALVVLGGFGYFIYTRYQASKERDTTGGTFGGSGSNQQEH